jgi:hypothetical protein
MNRLVGTGFSTAIAEAMTVIPTGLHRLIECDFFCGADPVFAGLTSYVDTDDGRSYRTTAHTLYEFHQEHMSRSQRAITVVLPESVSPSTVVHELGHVLHARLGFEPAPPPVNTYAATNKYEAFACAFTSWLYWGVGQEADPATVAQLTGLS